jgi:hypothetical protein
MQMCGMIKNVAQRKFFCAQTSSSKREDCYTAFQVGSSHTEEKKSSKIATQAIKASVKKEVRAYA